MSVRALSTVMSLAAIRRSRWSSAAGRAFALLLGRCGCLDGGGDYVDVPSWHVSWHDAAVLGSRLPSRLRAVAVGLGAGVTTFVALGWVVGTVLTLAVGTIHPDSLRSDSAPGWLDGLRAGLALLSLLPSCYVGWRTGRTALRSGPSLASAPRIEGAPTSRLGTRSRRPSPSVRDGPNHEVYWKPGGSDIGHNYFAVVGTLVLGTVIFFAAVGGFHAPFNAAFLVIFGPMFVAILVVAGVAGMRARPTPPTRRDWLNMSIAMALAVAAMSLFALGILTGHPALTIILACLAMVLLCVVPVAVVAVKVLRGTWDPDHGQ